MRDKARYERFMEKKEHEEQIEEVRREVVEHFDKLTVMMGERFAQVVERFDETTTMMQTLRDRLDTLEAIVKVLRDKVATLR